MDRPKSFASVTMVMAFLIAQIPFSMASWVAIGAAPGQTGTYDVIIQATYNNVTGTFPLQLIVNNTPYQTGNLTVEPIYPIPRTPPITLRYDIKLNGSAQFTMVSNNVTVYYLSGTNSIMSKDNTLVLGNDSYWATSVDVPFKGDYSAVVSLVVEKNGHQYGGQFMTYFTSDTLSPALTITTGTDKTILTPAESFEASLTPIFENTVLPNLQIFKANVYGTIKDLEWDSGQKKYTADLTAPTDEGTYLLNFYTEDESYISSKKIYVVDISKAKSARCPMSVNASGGCTDMNDVRKCVSDYKNGFIAIKESQLAQCCDSATGGIIQGAIICDSKKKGDFDGDNTLDADDLDLMQNMILPLSQTQRQGYENCADYNLDGKVDNSDLTCLTNVISGKWYGDFNGGICFDANYTSPLKGDLNNDKFVKDDDITILKKLVNASEAGIAIPQTILDATDFDQNGQLNQADIDCANYFNGMDLSNPETLLAAGSTIPTSCMSIYHLDNCQGIKGDLNGDMKIDAVDEILVMLAYRNQITGYNLACADVNSENGVTVEDVGCVKSYVAGDHDAYYICLHCSDATPAAYRATYEICGDGYDNNCDGLVDRTSTGSDDACLCNENTPCWMVKDADGGTVPGVDDGNVYVCRKVGWASGSTATAATPTNASNTATSGSTTSGWQWMKPDSLKCDSTRQCKSMECAQTVYKCAYSPVNKWQWYDINAGLPVETDDPNSVPKSCGDGYDNDCNCGDAKCQTEKSDSMYSSWQFWTAAVVGVAAGWATAGTAAPLLLSLLSTGGSVVIKDSGTQSVLSGFGLGLAVGSLANQAAQSYGTADKASKTAQDFGKFAKSTTISEYPSNAATELTGTQKWLSLGITNANTAAWAGGKLAASIVAVAGVVGTINAGNQYSEETKKWVKNDVCNTTTGY